MLWSSFKNTTKRFVGVDVGTFSVKVVELSASGLKKNLDNYGEVILGEVVREGMLARGIITNQSSSQEVAEAIKKICREAKIETKEAIFSIPDFSSFFTSFTLPPMTPEEIPMAVRFEARQYVPLPLSEVILDWSIIKNGNPSNKKEGIKILLVAVPHEVVSHYEEIGKFAQLKIIALEAEVFGLVRSLIKENDMAIGIIDVGAETTTMSVVDNGELKESHSLDISGNEMTRILSKSLNISYNEAEEMKMRHGIRSSEMNLAKTIFPFFDLLINDAGKVLRNFRYTENKEIKKIILAGGSALLPGLADYLNERLKSEIEIADPFYNISYPPVLEQTVKEMGPTYAVAIGMALRGLAV